MNPARIQVELDSGETREIQITEIQTTEIQATGDPRTLADILAAHALPLNLRCGQRGLCRGCEVELRAGGLAGEDGPITAPATVKACRARLAGDATLQVPARSILGHQPQVSETFEIAVPFAHQPLFPPVPGRDTAFAVDVGTTTVVVLLVDVGTGEVLSRAGAFNGQIRFGDNVVTRIEAARDPAIRAALQRALVAETIQPLLQRACERSGRSQQRLVGGAVAGNTTMLHLLAGEDPTSLGVAPFTPRFLASRQRSVAELGLADDGLDPSTPVQLLPSLAAYIGADITAGIVATGMAYDTRPSLLVDMGTNGEIVLQSGRRLTACATAAGPAFEGSGLTCGSRALAGAVSGLELRLRPFSLHAETIGHQPVGRAAGICGSAYVDFLATARSSGLLAATGRFDPAGWNDLPAHSRFTRAGERAIALPGAGDPGALRVSEADVASLLQAKAAIGAGIEILLTLAGVRAEDLGRVYLAGGFGMHINVAHAIAIGLLPGMRTEQVRVVGNTALAGALLALLDRSMLTEMEALRVRVIELNLADTFEDRYIEHLLLP